MGENYVSPRDLMNSELGGYSKYIIDHKSNNFWKTLSLGIINEDQIKRTKSIDLNLSKHSYSNFKTLSQDSSAFLTPQKQPSQNNLPRTTFFQESELIIDLKKKKGNKIQSQKWKINYHYFRNESRTIRIATLDARNRQDGEILYADNQNHINLQGFRRKSCECLIEGQIGSKLKRLGNYQTEIQFHKRKRLANILIDNLSQTKKRASTFGKHQIQTTRQKRGLKFKGINTIVQMPQLVRSSSFIDDSPISGQLLTSKVLFEGGSPIVIQNPSRFSLQDDSPMRIQIPQRFSLQRSIVIRSDSKLLTIQSPLIKTNKNLIQQLQEEEDEIVQTQSVHLIKVVSKNKLSEAQKILYYPRPKQMQRNILSVSSCYSQHTSDYTRNIKLTKDTFKILSCERNEFLNSQHMLPIITKKRNLSLNIQPQKFSEIYTNLSNRKSLFKRNICYKVKELVLSLNDVK